ncbi:MAG: hypothetical protein NWF01_03310 [Candidatus Bathyarchaeota archaeon]|nr:hypothetical protein [Candidatus Bathyarchaeota archaeon]
MAKTVNLPEKIHDDLVAVSEELTLMAKKPVSVSMTVSLLMEIYRAHMNNPCALDAFSQQMLNSDILSPEEFDNMWDEPLKIKPSEK